MDAETQPSHAVAHADAPPAGAWTPDWSTRRREAVEGLEARAHAMEAAVLEVARDPEVLIQAADRALAAGRAEQAAELFARAATLDPANPDARMGQAMALVSIDRYDQALPVYESLLEQLPADEAIRFNYAVALSRCGCPEQARKQYEALLDADANNLRARLNLASLLHARNHLNEASRHYRALLDDVNRLGPTDAAAVWANYGQLLLDLRNDEEAMRAFAESAKAQPDDAVAWLNLAQVARIVGRYGTAVAACKRAVTLEPQDPAIWERLGELYRELHHATGDESHLKQALECEEAAKRRQTQASDK